jgi:hypothetical protein
MLRKLIPHICIILALFIITYVILNEFNPSFFSMDFFKVTLIIYSIATMVAAGFLIAYNRRS